MKSILEILEDNRVKLSVEVDEAEFDKQIDAAFKRIAREVRVPGFRNGKAPRRLLEAQLGTRIGRSEAFREAMPEYYAKAVIEHDLDVIASPEIDITAGELEGPVHFDAVVEIRPAVNAGGYAGLRVEIPSPTPSCNDIDEQVTRMLRQYAVLDEVDRPAADGDHVTIDIVAVHDGEELVGLTTSDYDYEVGSDAIVAEVDEHLRGAAAGDELDFVAEYPDATGILPIEFEILVKEVRQEVLPELDDVWVREQTEFDSVDELRGDTEDRLRRIRTEQALAMLKQRTGEALAELVTDDVPDSLVTIKVTARYEDLLDHLEAEGLYDLDDFLATTGETHESVFAGFVKPALLEVKVDLALRHVAEAEGLVPDDAKLDEHLAEMAARTGNDPSELRSRLAEAGRLSELRADLAKQSAMTWLTDNVDLVDSDGVRIDREALVLPEPDDDARSASSEKPEEGLADSDEFSDRLQSMTDDTVNTEEM